MYTIKIAAKAFKDIREAACFYDKRLEGLGSSFKKQVKGQLDRLEYNAELYEIRYKDIRCMSISKFPFLVHFTVDKSNKIVQVLAIIHTSRSPKVWEQKTGDF